MLLERGDKEKNKNVNWEKKEEGLWNSQIPVVWY